MDENDLLSEYNKIPLGHKSQSHQRHRLLQNQLQNLDRLCTLDIR